MTITTTYDKRSPTRFDIGVEDIDAEHRIQIGLIRALQRAIVSGESADTSQEIIAKLGDYTAMHFGSEELLMGLNFYPDLNEHRSQHSEMLLLLAEVKNKAKTAPPALSLGLVNALAAKLIGHIQTADKTLALYLKEKGALDLEIA